MKIFLRFWICMAAVVLIAGCATTPPIHTGGEILLQEICKKYNIQWQFDHITQVVLLDYKGQKAKALIGSPVVLIGQQKITLQAPLRRVNSAIYVPSDFESKVVGPFGAVPSKLGYAGELSDLKVRTIVIDAGHGGKDPGAKGDGGVREKEVTLDIAKRLKELLQDSGLTVIMTRSADTFPTLIQRTEMSTDNKVDLFVSIHANSNPSKKMQGVEVYYVKTQNKRDLDEEQRQKNEKAFFRGLGAPPNRIVQGIVYDMMYQLKVSESSKLAMRIVHDASSDLSTPNRGARHARFFVVRNTLMPAVLVETGFLSNRQEERKLNTSTYRQKVAESIARSILTYASST